MNSVTFEHIKEYKVTFNTYLLSVQFTQNAVDRRVKRQWWPGWLSSLAQRHPKILYMVTTMMMIFILVILILMMTMVTRVTAIDQGKVTVTLRKPPFSHTQGVKQSVGSGLWIYSWSSTSATYLTMLPLLKTQTVGGIKTRTQDCNATVREFIQLKAY